MKKFSSPKRAIQDFRFLCILLGLFLVAPYDSSFAETVTQNGFTAMRVHDKLLRKATTGKVAKPVRVRSYVSSESFQRYQINIGGKWIKGRCTAGGMGELHAVLVDLNFDGYADVLITGYTDSHGRSRCSDAWLYDLATKKYVYNHALSAIPNLDVSAVDKLIEGGMSNCGCAAQCFFNDVYAWDSSQLKKIARREQDCETYREFSSVDGVLTQTKEEPVLTDKYVERQSGSSTFIDLLTDTEISPLR